MAKGNELKVFISTRESKCGECGEDLGRHAWITLDVNSVRLAVAAHVRHAETEYDELLLRGLERLYAREKIHAELDDILEKWEYGEAKETGRSR